MFQNYGNDNIFQVLLYPYIPYETVNVFEGMFIFMRLLEYLRECCNEIGRILNKMDDGGADFTTYLPLCGEGRQPDKKIHYAMTLAEILDATISTRFVRHLYL